MSVVDKGELLEQAADDLQKIYDNIEDFTELSDEGLAFCLVFDESFKDYLKNNKLSFSTFCFDKLYRNCLEKEQDCLKIIKKINYSGNLSTISKYCIAVVYGLLTGFRVKSINTSDKAKIVEFMDNDAKPMILKLIRGIKHLLIDKNV